jgi:hypothetical protein
MQPPTVSRVQLLYTVKKKGGKRDRKAHLLPYGLGQVWELSRLCPETSTKLNVHEFVFCHLLMGEVGRTGLDTEVFDILDGNWSTHDTDALLVSKYFVSCFRQRTRELAWKLLRGKWRLVCELWRRQVPPEVNTWRHVHCFCVHIDPTSQEHGAASPRQDKQADKFF